MDNLDSNNIKIICRIAFAGLVSISAGFARFVINMKDISSLNAWHLFQHLIGSAAAGYTAYFLALGLTGKDFIAAGLAGYAGFLGAEAFRCLTAALKKKYID